MDVTLACDVMLDLEGSIRPALYLAQSLVENGYKVFIMSPMISREVEERLREGGITPINLRAKLIVKNSGLSMIWFETWIREAFLGLNSRCNISKSSIVINFSQVITIPSSVWYLQGPLSLALKDLEKELSSSFKIAYNLLKPIIEYADRRLVNRMANISAMIVANSKFCASMYSFFGVNVDDVIYPPIDCEVFHPSTSNPSSDYVLTYFGKETEFSVVKRIADMNVKIKAFGSKTHFIPEKLLNHPNIDYVGRVSTSKLVNLYSNALFTIFPFTHEPFGYVPLESIACGTPVLTYDFQGPGEYVIDGKVGWLASFDEKIIQTAIDIWKNGYPQIMRKHCVENASKLDKKCYIEKWSKILLTLDNT
jgi:glycosyltransferase involved in cell wall biosynthesis